MIGSTWATLDPVTDVSLAGPPVASNPGHEDDQVLTPAASQLADLGVSARAIPAESAADWSTQQWKFDQLEWFLLAAVVDREISSSLERGVLPAEAAALSTRERQLLRTWLPGNIRTIAGRLNALLTGQSIPASVE